MKRNYLYKSAKYSINFYALQNNSNEQQKPIKKRGRPKGSR